MLASLLIVIAASGPGQVERRSEPVARKIADEVARRGYRRVGVVPRFLVNQAGRTFLVTEAGPEVDRLPEVLARALTIEARRHPDRPFEVLDMIAMRAA